MANSILHSAYFLCPFVLVCKKPRLIAAVYWPLTPSLKRCNSALKPHIGRAEWPLLFLQGEFEHWATIQISGCRCAVRLYNEQHYVRHWREREFCLPGSSAKTSRASFTDVLCSLIWSPAMQNPCLASN